MQLIGSHALREEMPTIRKLAVEIWWDHYPGIITPAQIEYMLETMYGEPELEKCWRRPNYRFTLFRWGAETVGFAGCVLEPDRPRLFLDKLYLLTQYQGRGLGQQMLAHVETQCREHRLGRIELRVNRKNERALTAYRRTGFVIAAQIRSDIGKGFVMDDFLMRKEVP